MVVQPVNGPVQHTMLQGLDCTSASQCLAVGLSQSTSGVAQGMHFGPPAGGQWLSNAPTDADACLAVSCLGNQCCLAGQQYPSSVVAAKIYETGNGGGAWTALSLPKQPSSYSVVPAASPGQPFPSALDVTCKHSAGSTLQAKSDCYAVEWDGGQGGGAGSGYPPELVYSHNGGATWKVGNLGNLQGTLFDGISCPNSVVCYAFGQYGNSGAVWVTTDGGAAWTRETVTGSVQVTSVSCPTTSTCFAGATTNGVSEVFETTDGGYTTPPPPTPPTSVTAKAGVKSTEVKWKAPVFNAGAPIAHYVVKPLDHTTSTSGTSVEVSGSVLSVNMTGLASGHHYSFTVKAKTVDGTSAPSSASNTVVPTS